MKPIDYQEKEKIHFDIKKTIQADYSFNIKRIPQIIDENYLLIHSN